MFFGGKAYIIKDNLVCESSVNVDDLYTPAYSIDSRPLLTVPAHTSTISPTVQSHRLIIDSGAGAHLSHTSTSPTRPSPHTIEGIAGNITMPRHGTISVYTRTTEGKPYTI